MYYRWWYDHNILGRRIARDAMAGFPLPLKKRERSPNLFRKIILKLKGTPWDIPDQELKS